MNLEELIEDSSRQEVSKFKESLARYFKKWPWLLLGTIIALVIAFFYLKSVPNTYKVTSKVQIKKSNQIDNPGELLFGRGFNSRFKGLSDEITLFQSYPLVEKTIQSLQLDIHYYAENGFRKVEVYKKTPFVFQFDREQNRSIPTGVEFEIKEVGQDQLSIKTEKEFEGELINSTVKYGQELRLGSFVFKLERSLDEVGNESKAKLYYVKISSIVNETFSYRNKLNFDSGEGLSTILSMSMKTNLPQKSIDFIDAITAKYIEQNLKDKNEIANNTVEFIDQQLATISDSLAVREENLEQFKSSESLEAISVEGEVLIEKYNEIETERAQYEVMQQYYDYLGEKLETQDGRNLENLIAPSAFGISDLIINDLVKSLLDLNLTRSKLIKDGNTKNPMLSQIENRRTEVVGALEESIENLSKANRIVLNNLNKRARMITASAQKLPVTERRLVNLNRLLKLNENIYLFLMEKRSSAAITMSSNTSDCKVIEPAMLNPIGPVSPNRQMVYLMAILLGLFIPLVTIIVLDFLNDTVQSKEDVEGATTLPLIGVLPKEKEGKNHFVAIESPKSALAESFRLVRANLSYFQKKQSPYVIMLTSTVAKEGKTFSAINLASVLAASGKKTVLLGFDLRKPQLHNYLNLTNGEGISNYLSSSLSLNEILRPSKQKNLSIILSGSVPPNPAELIIGERTKELFDELRQQFDYIVIDTPPVGLVADARVLSQESDLNIYVVRQGYSKREYLNNMNDLSKSGKLKNLGVLLNDSVNGNRYGYGYYEDEGRKEGKTFFRRFKSRRG